MQTSVDSFESSNRPSEDLKTSSETIQDLNKLFKSKKPSKNRLFRKKTEGDDFKENGFTAGTIEAEIKRDELHELLELRKLTNRKQRGLDAAQLGKGDPKQLNATDVQEAKIIEEVPKSKKGMMESFTKQTNVMDIDKHMTDYIESQIEKLKNGTELQADLNDREAPDESLPEYLRLKNIRGNEGDVILSSAMLTAIPEVDLGIENQLKNIEETEIAKQALFDKSLSVKHNNIDNILPINPYGMLGNINRNSSPKKPHRPITDKEAVARFKKRLRR